ncbi:hypothetical protein [Pseudonocardia sp. H11422]|uniref:hypothetical protein n=1 Tax=Pseudonocardia sp. H11422 TaxID=2835866 RepID=UPI001BDBDC9F|nr:hypothetical protein [Pseudonocardia sp. H11422]
MTAPLVYIAAPLSNIRDGSCLDVLDVIVGDAAFRGGSIFHAAGTDQLFLIRAGALMTVVVTGLLVRQRVHRGPSPPTSTSRHRLSSRSINPPNSSVAARTPASTEIATRSARSPH